MLLTKNISTFEHGSPEWFEARKSKFTSSEIHLLMGKKEFTEAALSYIYRKVGEDITGIPVTKEIETEATAHGNVYEPEAIRKYGRLKGLDYVITQKLVFDSNPFFSTTPDFLQLESAAINENKEPGYNVTPGEVKCPFTYDAFISLSLCETPLQLKEYKPQYYWQLLDQMLICGSLKGVFVIYHPDFAKASFKEIEFRKLFKDDSGNYPIKKDIDLLQERKLLAVKKFKEVKEKLLS